MTNLEKKYHNFSIHITYADTLDIITSFVIKTKAHPQFVIKNLCQEAELLNIIAIEISKEYNFTYRGQTLAQFGEHVRKIVMTNDRCIPQHIKDEIFNRQEGLCKACGLGLDVTMQLDHIRRVSDGGDNDSNNLQYLCESCHNDKT